MTLLASPLPLPNQHFGPTQLTTTSETTLYTVPAAKQAILREVVLTNGSASAVTIGVSIVRSGGSGSTANRILGAVSLPANTTEIVAFEQHMSTGDFVSAQAGTSTVVVITGSTYES